MLLQREVLGVATKSQAKPPLTLQVLQIKGLNLHSPCKTGAVAGGRGGLT